MRFQLNALSPIRRLFHSNPVMTSTTNVTLPKFLRDKRPKESPQFDYSTLSNYQFFKVVHSTFDIELNFELKKVIGSIKYDLLTLSQVSKIILDSSFIKINDIKINGESTNDYKINDVVEPLGSAIEINKEIAKDIKFELLIDFETTEKTTALQWLKTKPESKHQSDYVFTQLEPIHARSLFPCFDTPSIKSTFSAKIKSSNPVVFSGLPLGTPEANVYEFEQKIPIPSYLIGIASGNIISAKVGPRSTIYAEPEVLQDAKNEFEEDVENFIKIAEKIITPYIWTTYDFLINPASFPYGGMENPNITFVTPTLISYDKSQVDVIAHELAHSWSGNNVTNASWEHFYLNEGWTVYLERRITSTSIDGVLDEKSRHFQYILGWNDLVESIKSLGKFEYSRLVQDLQKGKIDPDDTFSSVPYEKGANFLFHLETQLGGIKEFDPFIKHYFNKFSQQSIDTFQFLDSLFEFYGNDSEKLAILNNIDWELWLYTPGLPPKADFDTTLVDAVAKLTNEWIEKSKEFTKEQEFIEYFNAGFLRESYDSFTSPQKILFIDSLLEKKPSKTFWKDYSAASDSLITIYKDLQSSRNTEIIFRWFKLKLSAEKNQYYQDLSDWLGTVGRMKYVRPSYRQLNLVDHELAVETFKKYELRYHPIAANLVRKDLGL